jgi:hypothetical protein
MTEERRMRGSMTLVAVGFAVLCAPAVAHHSYSDIYLEADTIEIEGTIVEFQYRNPHSWLHVAGQEGALGTEKIYAAEWVSTSQLEREGIGRNFFRVGDRVRMWGSPPRRPGDNRLHVKRIRRSDGWEWRPRRPAAPVTGAPTAR